MNMVKTKVFVAPLWYNIELMENSSGYRVDISKDRYSYEIETIHYSINWNRERILEDLTKSVIPHLFKK